MKRKEKKALHKERRNLQSKVNRLLPGCDQKIKKEKEDRINEITQILQNAKMINNADFNNGPTGHGDVCYSDADPCL